MMEFLITGILLGMAAGMAPGPLLALVVSETLTGGFKSGAAVAFAPLITDAPIVLLCLGVTAGVSSFAPALGGISLAGAVFVFYLGIDLFRHSTPLAVSETETAESPTSYRKTLGKGLLANALSPHPWLFWMTVGGPLIVRAFDQKARYSVGFLAGFYGLLVGSKIFFAALVARSRSFLTGRVHGVILKILGVFLCGLGILLLRESLRYFGL